MTTIRSQTTMYLRHEGGATHELGGRRFKKLRKELLAGRGGVEVTNLVASGYVGYLADDGTECSLDNLSGETFTTNTES